ncbi:hypothetical protein F4811DRAFT_557535 [Daldinia bambusicola]|nr:hypothetical protein F4811DRAFT_557535 [Daldinia bambusicola]
MVTQTEAEAFNRTLAEELSEIPVRVTKSGGTNLSHYLALLRETFNVLSKHLPELNGSSLFQDTQMITTAEGKDAIKLETVEQLRTFLLKSNELAEAVKPKGAPSLPPKEESQAEKDGDIRRLTASESKDFKRLVDLFVVILDPPWRPQPPRPDLRTRAVRPPRASSSQFPKETRQSGSPQSSSKGKEKSTSEQEPEQELEQGTEDPK